MNRVKTCAFCGHMATMLGGAVTEPNHKHYDLCHGCDMDHDCYHQWTVYGQRPQLGKR